MNYAHFIIYFKVTFGKFAKKHYICAVKYNLRMKEILYIGSKELDFVRSLKEEDGFFFCEDFLMAYRTLRPLLKMATGPFHSNEMRMLRVTSGEARYMVNLVAYDISRGNILLMPANSLIEVVWYSDDFNAQFILFANDVKVDDMGRLVSLSPREYERTGLYFELIWNTVKLGGFRKDVLRHLCDTLVADIKQIDLNDTTNSGKDEQFMKFVTLVNKHSQQERSLDFYADKLAMTSHYLSAYIRRASGRTFTQWINFSLLQKIRTQLCYTNKRISEISLEMGFENSSDFSRFFKKQTGMTPNEYRNSK